MSSSLVQFVGFDSAPPAPTVIRLAGPITAATAADVKRRIRRAGATGDIVLRLNTPGGSVTAAAEIADLVRAHRGKTAGIVEPGGHCDSAAVLALAACRRRNAGPAASFQFHGAASAPDKIADRLTAAVLRREAASNEQLDAMVARKIAAWIGTPAATIASLIRDETKIDARRAVAIGLLTRVPGREDWSVAAIRARRQREALTAHRQAEIADAGCPLIAAENAAVARLFCGSGDGSVGVVLGITRSRLRELTARR